MRKHEQSTWLNKLKNAGLSGLLIAGLSIASMSGGYGQTLVSADFTGQTLPTGWDTTAVTNDGNWAFDNPKNRSITAGSTGFDNDFAIFDSDNWCGSNEDATLTTPSFNASGTNAFILSFDNSFRNYGSQEGVVEVWDGSTWNTVLTLSGADDGYPTANHKTIDITAATGGSPAAKVRFHWQNGSCDWWWAIDNVEINAISCVTPSGIAVSAGTSANAAVVSWGSPTIIPGNGYEYYYNTTGTAPVATTTPSGSVTDTTVTLNSLSAGTRYYFWVRSVCSATDQSDWSAAFSFYIPPANDECVNAVNLTVNPDLNCGTTTHGTVAGATASGGSTPCYGTPDDDVWYKFTATDTIHQISLTNITGSATDMYMELLDGCGGNSVECSDPESFTQSGLTIGHTYYLRVYTYTSTPLQTSEFDVCVGSLPPPPANDECTNAINLTVNPDMNCGTTTHGTVAGATASGGSTPCYGTPDDDVWYKFTATDTMHQISLTNITGSATDMYMELLDGCGGNNVECSDPESFTQSGLTIGHTYYLRVYTYTSTPLQTSQFDVCIGTVVPPSNDECANAIDISSGQVFTGNTTEASQSMPVGNCGSGTANDVWYALTPVASGSLTIEADPSSTDIVLAIDSGSCGNFTELDCADNSYGTESATFNVTAGITYYVRVYGYNGDEGPFTIQASGIPLPITMTDLKGRLNDRQQAELSWETLSESNSKGFEVQRSKNGSDFHAIGYVLSKAADGMSHDLLAYRFTDSEPVNEKAYYRLMQEDLNGHKVYSKVIMLAATQKEEQLFLTAHPNPVRQNSVTINIHGAHDDSGQLMITNLLGRTLARYSVKDDTYQINMEKLPAGMYLVKYIDRSRSSIIKIVKE